MPPTCWNRFRIAIALLFTACSGDDGGGAGTDGTSSGSSTDAGPTSTTQPATTTEGPMGTGESTAVADSSSGGASESASSTADASSDTSGSGSSDATTGDSTGDSTTGGAMLVGYEDCTMDADVCAPAEMCLPLDVLPAGSAAPSGVCGVVPCLDAEVDCEAGLPGFAPAACIAWPFYPSFCGLDCSEGQPCPDGMTCMWDAWCSWLTPVPGGGACPDQDLAGMPLPLTVLGDTQGLGDDHFPLACHTPSTEDELLSFTAPADGSYRFEITDGVGNEPGTYLFVLDACDGQELASVFTHPAEVQALLLSLDEGETVILGVDGDYGEVGPYVLQIDYAGPSIPGGSCCTPGACSVPEIASCVEFALPWCGDDWNGQCAQMAVACAADC